MAPPPGRTYYAPTTVTDALTLLTELGPDAGVVAGGTDLVVAARRARRQLPSAIVAIHRLPDLAGIDSTAHDGLHLGALVTHADIAAAHHIRDKWSALADSSALVGSPATRHLGTLGGNLCNASPAMETGGPLLVFDADVELWSAAGRRTVPLASFLVGAGQTALARGELLTGVMVPPPPAGRVGSAYVRLQYRASMEIAVVGAAAFVVVDDDGRCADARIALTAVAPMVIRAPEAEAILRGRVATGELVSSATLSAADVARPIDDVRASAAYRLAMVQVIVRRAVELAFQRAAKSGP